MKVNLHVPIIAASLALGAAACESRVENQPFTTQETALEEKRELAEDVAGRPSPEAREEIAELKEMRTVEGREKDIEQLEERLERLRERFEEMELAEGQEEKLEEIRESADSLIDGMDDKYGELEPAAAAAAYQADRKQAVALLDRLEREVSTTR